VALATAATIIASQSIISGTFSMTRQAIQLGLCPRLHITQTSSEGHGQTYVGFVSWALMVLTLGLARLLARARHQEKSRNPGGASLSRASGETATSGRRSAGLGCHLRNGSPSELPNAEHPARRTGPVEILCVLGHEKDGRGLETSRPLQ
jgi:K+ potassium transporter integral membrane domain